MIVSSARRAIADIFSPAIRMIFLKVLALTIGALLALWLLLRQIFVSWAMPWIGGFLPEMPDWAGWLGFIASVVATLGLALAVAMLLAPVSAIVAGFFLDDAAEIIERRDYASERAGVALPLAKALASSLRFFGIVILANLAALLMLLVPFVNVGIFFLVNGYLIGREYFEFAAARHLGIQGAREFRRQNRGTVLVAGFLVALFLFVPIVNLLTPLFAALMMVHLFKALEKTPSSFR